MLNKTEQIAYLIGENGSMAIPKMLTGYRSTAQSAEVTPYEALMNRQIGIKLDYQPKERVMRMLATPLSIRWMRYTKN